MRLYYRARKDGAQVFRMETDNRQRRLELRLIATVTASGEILPHKRRAPTTDEITEIGAWWAEFQPRREAGALSESEQVIAAMHALANRLQKDAPQDEVERDADPLLLAMHDLRQVIVRRLARMDDED